MGSLQSFASRDPVKRKKLLNNSETQFTVQGVWKIPVFKVVMYMTETTTTRFISWVFDNKVPFTLVFYLLDSGQDQVINSTLEETIKEFRGWGRS